MIKVTKTYYQEVLSEYAWDDKEIGEAIKALKNSATVKGQYVYLNSATLKPHLWFFKSECAPFSHWVMATQEDNDLRWHNKARMFIRGAKAIVKGIEATL